MAREARIGARVSCLRAILERRRIKIDELYSVINVDINARPSEQDNGCNC